MHGAGLQAEMCVSSWGILDGHFLKNGEGYGIYAKTGVDVMMSMAGTYFGTNVTKDVHNIELEIKQGVTLSQLAVGIGTQINPSVAAGCPKVGQMGCHTVGGQCYNWTRSRLETFVADCVSRGVRTIDMWRADIDSEGDCTEPYYFQVAERFLAGQAPELKVNSLKSDDDDGWAGGGTFNVMDFGAKGDGVTYDTAAVRKAAEALAAAGGGELLFPAGHTVLTAPFVSI